MKFQTSHRQQPHEGTRIDPATDLAQQQYKNDCDYNRIIKRALNGDGELPPNPYKNRAFYADMSRVENLQQAMDMIKEAKNEFMRLDPKLRYMFNNDAIAMADTLTTLHGMSDEQIDEFIAEANKGLETYEAPTTREEMEAWGLIPPRAQRAPEKEPAPQRTEPAPK